MRRTASAVTAAALTTALLTTGAVVGPAVSPPGPGPVLSEVAAVAWGPCAVPDLPDVPATYQCATYDVPLDHADPSGPTIELALIRRPADDPDARQGSLFVNFGGPGADAVSSIALVGETYFAPAVTAEFDVIGMDPRGIGRSTPLQCVGPEDDPADYFTAFVWPESARDLRTVRDVNAALDARCVAEGGPLRDHMSTTAVADDLDLLRRAVGDEQLTYVGYSYGSYLGAVYANRYPDKVGALVVDGVVDPVDWTTGRDVDGTRVPIFARMNSDDGAQATLEEFFRLCDEAGAERCAFSGPGEASASDRFDALYERLRVEPVLDPGTGMLLNHQLLAALTRSGLDNSPTWHRLAQSLAGYEQLASGAPGATPTDAAGATGRSAADALPSQVLAREQLGAVACLDGVTPDRVSDWKRAEVSQGVGYFGPLWTWIDQQCMSWSAEDVDRYQGPWDALTANPVLVVSTRFDPATDYSGALALHAELPSSRLLTVEGWGHSSTGLSACADAVTTEYLLTRQVPKEDVVCTQDIDPFPSAAQVRASAADPDALARSERREGVLRAIGSPLGAVSGSLGE
ncbi:alpha/beta hydrolase [Actinotalea sp. K2]|uniref:alpha/beta hydrolase n=1 Tax=Actinotalea sp. K2 TaxID=2939438 RepID=UPI0020176BAB|nr:alpha/beta hydrolase [Actinotalea sp. K2]MCL3862123.1 alpha/beta hydrolase [Actinotalea sp. K2]